MNKNEIKKEFQERFLELRKILNSWELMPGSPKDELDSLNHQILGHLYKESDFGKIERVLMSELTVKYGLTIENEEVRKITEEICSWWKSNNVTY